MKITEYMAKNQVILELQPGVYVFQSYDSIVAMKFNGSLYIDRRTYDYSKTTAKYRNRFFGVDNAEFKRMLKDGKIQIIDNLENYVEGNLL